MMKSAVIITILLLSSFVASAETVYTVDCNGGGDFRTIQACFDALPSKPAEWRTVRIMPGVYREKVTLDVYKDKVRILGDEMAETRIVWGDYAGKVVDGRELTFLRLIVLVFSQFHFLYLSSLNPLKTG